MRVALTIAGSSNIVIPVSADASTMLGVSNDAKGTSRVRMAETPFLSRSASPVVAIITGSTTHGVSSWAWIESATT